MIRPLEERSEAMTEPAAVWQEINTVSGQHWTEATSRMVVPGGWLYRTVTTLLNGRDQVASSEALAFVPEPAPEPTGRPQVVAPEPTV
jgi:hypothetical protein